jgi:diguanylate cyclase (GGDEF)-like protein
MNSDPFDRLTQSDHHHAVQLSERVWWVGHVQDQDVFQCHVYLIEQGDQSVLIDPGSCLTFEHTLRKIEEVIPLTAIRYFICQHQDPDIAAAMPLIDRIVSREDAVLVTHWRAQMLLKHYGLRMPFWLIDQHDWNLALEDRTLRFVFTPYAHFPGAFCTYDTASQVLFSSDLFGGLTEKFALVAEDEHYFEAMRPFHEHYMPSREILGYALAQIEAQPLQMIAPQHGSIIPGPLIPFMVAKLKQLDCGLYLLARNDTDIHRLSRLNQSLREITQVMVLYRDFRDIVDQLLSIVQRYIPTRCMEFYAQFGEDKVLHLSPETRYVGVEVDPPELIRHLLNADLVHWRRLQAQEPWRSSHFLHRDRYCLSRLPEGQSLLTLPLVAPSEGTIKAVARMYLSEPIPFTEGLEQIVEQISMPLEVAIERELIYRALDWERQKFYERSIRDPLTQLFTRLYMQDVVQRLCELQDREPHSILGAAMIDIDHFKQINDTFGHQKGDEVLRRVAREILDTIRATDVPVRYGGEEFIVFGLVGQPSLDVLAERLRARIAGMTYPTEQGDQQLTISIGVGHRRPGEPLARFIQRIDALLYQAKRRGRNRVCVANEETVAGGKPA